MNTRTRDPKPDTPTPVDHEHPVHQDTDCPEHHDRCHITLHGYMDCPKPHTRMKTEMLTVGCGSDDPKPQIASFLAMPGHNLANVIQVIDLGHNGWLVIFSVPD